jgi:HK97 family phage major capsid protein
LPQHLQTFYTNTLSNRPAIDAVNNAALVSTGMSFTVPRLTTAPTVAETAEGAAPSETGMVSDYLTVNVKKYSGSQDISFELIDRSSPEFYSLMLAEMQNAYAKATDAAVLAAFVSSGTLTTETYAATAAGFTAFCGDQQANTLGATGKFAKNVVINPSWWGSLLGAVDGSSRPVYTALNPQNNPGNLDGRSLNGNILGLNTYVDPYVTATTKIDESAFIIAPETVYWYEAPQTRLQVNMIETGQLRVGVYGYGAIAVLDGKGIRKFNLT